MNPDPSQHQKDTDNLLLLAEAIDKIIGDGGVERGRFIDLKRIPLICLQITGIHESLKEIRDMMKDVKGEFVTKESFAPVKTITFGLVGLILVGVVSAILSMILAK